MTSDQLMPQFEPSSEPTTVTETQVEAPADTQIEMQGETATATEAAVPRRRLSRWRIAGLAVAILLLGGAVAVLVTGSSDKRAAEQDQAHATQQLRRQQAQTKQTEAQLEAGRAKLNTVVVGLATPLATANGIGDLITQGGAAQHAVQDAGVSGSVDDYNTAVDHSNAIVEQFNAAVKRLDQQIAGLQASASQRV